MVIPPLVMARLGAMPALSRNPRLALITEVGVGACCIFAGVPAALGVFPQTDSIAASELEPEFRAKVDSKGAPVRVFFYNKGL